MRSEKQLAFIRGIRAQAAETAYQTALGYIQRLPIPEVIARLEEKIEEKRREIDITAKVNPHI